MNRTSKQPSIENPRPTVGWRQRLAARVRFLLADFISGALADYEMTPTEAQYSELFHDADMKVKIFMDHLCENNPHPEAVARSQQAAVAAWRKMKTFPASLRNE